MMDTLVSAQEALARYLDPKAWNVYDAARKNTPTDTKVADHFLQPSLEKASGCLKVLNFFWKPMGSAPKTPHIGKPIYLLAYVPDNASKLDPASGVCVIWWEPEQNAWYSEAGEEGVTPSFWFMEITAPSANHLNPGYQRGFIPPYITDQIEAARGPLMIHEEVVCSFNPDLNRG